MAVIDTTTAGVELADEPALVVTFGTTAKKRRSLNKATTVLGRLRSADIRLDAPEIANIHCLITRTETGLAVRDCESRTGTLVNGQPVREAELHDGDNLQVGPFSFKVSLPAVAPPASVRLPANASDGALADRLGEIQETEARLHLKQRTLEQQAEQLAAELKAMQERAAACAQQERELSEAQGRLEAERQAFRERQAEQPSAAAAPAIDVDALRREVLANEIAPLQTENNTLRSQVAEFQRRLAGQERDLLAARQQLEAAAAQPAAAAANGNAEAIQRENDDLRRQVAEIEQQNSRLLHQLETVQHEAETRLTTLRADLDTERTRVKELVREAANQYSASRQEIADLHRELDQRDAQLAAAGGGIDPNIEYELETLRATVADLQNQLVQQQHQPQLPPIPTDLSAYEQQLNDFRAQLEFAQQQLADQERQQHEKSRENELQLSKERAALAREKSMLDKTRFELKTELERAEREAKRLEQMASINKLTHEVRTQGKGDVADDTNTLSGRIRGFLKRMGDS